ncbi:MAG TPA: hypothetical protein VGQ03_05850 [Nitrososphaera sp.]|jgi:hypothetical protein|nr:hypothetical protein [Nitrososphaera sp.]
MQILLLIMHPPAVKAVYKRHLGIDSRVERFSDAERGVAGKFLIWKRRRTISRVVMQCYLAVDNKSFSRFKQPPDVLDKLVLVAFVKWQD